ncbi:MAG TPA: hypothetical protein VGE38_13345 [Nocardioides sp.]|uniref:hypothetical protein n=1 Tax=Nocardioides sp. TaxID=35761 RepID=UPI002ED82DF2
MKKTLSPTAVLGTLSHTVRHPRRSVGEAVALARGVAMHLMAGRESQPGWQGSERAGSTGPVASPAAPTKVHGDKLAPESAPQHHGSPAEAPEAAEAGAAEPAVSSAPAEPAEPRPAVTTEPSSPAGAGGEVDEMLDEAAQELEDDDTGITTPVGTTGADVGHNPDTAETDLQQPGTEPLMDPSTTKKIKAESDVLRKAADPDKG